MRGDVIGLDLSLTATGVATEAGTEVLATRLRGCERLAWLRDSIWDRLMTARAGTSSPLVVVEDYAFSRANQAHAKGELGGVIRLALHEAGIAAAYVKPSTLKKYATGKGNADKDLMRDAARDRGGLPAGVSNDECDAWWLRQMGLAALMDPAAVYVPAAHQVALTAVDWPEVDGMLLDRVEATA